MTAALPAELYLPDQVRALDRLAVERGIATGYELMQRAGRAAWNLFRHRWPEAARVTVLCGSGNNGGDGYVFARLAREQGREVTVLALKSPDALKGDALLAAADYVNAGGAVQQFSEAMLVGADVVVDAILGSGLDGGVSAAYSSVIDAVNTAQRPVLALDLPSGLDAARGRVDGSAIHATETLAFVALTPGLFTGAGPAHTGIVRFAALDLPAELGRELQSCALRIDYDTQSSLLGPRPRDAHKGAFGHVLLIGGDHGYAGAIRLAAEAAARCGAGLVSVATRPEHAAAITTARPEIMARGVTEPRELNVLLERATVVGIGPGLGRAAWATALMARVRECRLPQVWDADALHLLADEPAGSEQRVLTPHPGEAARLLDCDTGDVQSDRLAAAAELQERYGGVIVLKGAGTIVAAAESRPAICSDGNPGLASGGTGDVLTGVIAALLAQGHGALQSARLGVCLHARAGDRAAANGERGMLAGDLLPWLRRLCNPQP
jgi:NAD(P)H-hydrate epimerase